MSYEASVSRAYGSGRLFQQPRTKLTVLSNADLCSGSAGTVVVLAVAHDSGGVLVVKKASGIERNSVGLSGAFFSCSESVCFRC